MNRLRGKLGLTLTLLFGVFAGAGAFTFDYGEGTSYLGTNPASCANCHVMQPHYDSWQKASHHAVARCVDCHLPHDTIPKYIAKADNGFWHSYGFTFQNFHEPIRIKPRNSHILQENCVACHRDMVHGLVAGATTDADAVTCVHCHADVGHGPTR